MEAKNGYKKVNLDIVVGITSKIPETTMMEVALQANQMWGNPHLSML